MAHLHIGLFDCPVFAPDLLGRPMPGSYSGLSTVFRREKDRDNSGQDYPFGERKISGQLAIK